MFPIKRLNSLIYALLFALLAATAAPSGALAGGFGLEYVAGDELAAEGAQEDDAFSPYEEDGSILVTISATGDVTIGGDVRKSGKSLFDKQLDKQEGDITFPFRNVKDIFNQDDLTIVNFEGTLTTAPINREKKDNAFLFSAPPEYAAMFDASGVEAVSLENNHVMDHGEQGYADTCAALDGAGILYSGHLGSSIYTTQTGIQIGMLSYQTFNGKYPEIYENMPGDIQALRDAGCQIVVVSYHWGEEKDYAPNERQVPLGRATIDAGADLVLGHHSHRINPIEYYKGKYICYSLGNFSFAGNGKPSDMDTFIFQQRIRVKPDGTTEDAGMRIIPSRISSVAKSNDFMPTPFEAGGEDALRIAGKLVDLGKNLEYALDYYPLDWE